jgi:hypothetical protein
MSRSARMHFLTGEDKVQLFAKMIRFSPSGLVCQLSFFSSDSPSWSWLSFSSDLKTFSPLPCLFGFLECPWPFWNRLFLSFLQACSSSLGPLSLRFRHFQILFERLISRYQDMMSQFNSAASAVEISYIILVGHHFVPQVRH